MRNICNGSRVAMLAATLIVFSPMASSTAIARDVDVKLNLGMDLDVSHTIRWGQINLFSNDGFYYDVSDFEFERTPNSGYGFPWVVTRVVPNGNAALAGIAEGAIIDRHRGSFDYQFTQSLRTNGRLARSRSGRSGSLNTITLSVKNPLERAARWIEVALTTVGAQPITHGRIPGQELWLHNRLNAAYSVFSAKSDASAAMISFLSCQAVDLPFNEFSSTRVNQEVRSAIATRYLDLVSKIKDANRFFVPVIADLGTYNFTNSIWPVDLVSELPDRSYERRLTSRELGAVEASPRPPQPPSTARIHPILEHRDQAFQKMKMLSGAVVAGPEGCSSFDDEVAEPIAGYKTKNAYTIRYVDRGGINKSFPLFAIPIPANAAETALLKNEGKRRFVFVLESELEKPSSDDRDKEVVSTEIIARNDRRVIEFAQALKSPNNQAGSPSLPKTSGFWAQPGAGETILGLRQSFDSTDEHLGEAYEIRTIPLRLHMFTDQGELITVISLKQ